MRPAERREIMKVALTVRKVGQHWPRLKFGIALMFWEETSFPENTKQTAYNVHSFHLMGE